MNTKVKVGIAAAIVAALVALIVLDQKTGPRDAAQPAAAPAAPDAGGIILAPPAPSSGDGAVRAIREEQVQDLIRKAREQFSPPAEPVRRAEEPARAVTAPAPSEPALGAGGEEYLVKSGDTLGTIAQAHYGSTTFQSLITSANPGLKPLALRIGQKLVLPPKPQGVEKQVDESVAKAVLPEPAPASLGPNRVYVVQAGDTLSQISAKIYKTSRYVDRIVEANSGTLSDPHFLTVGMKLTMPDLPVRNASASTGTAATAAVPGPTHTVASGDSLWKIAERYAATKGVGILEMIQLFVKANPDKLKDDKSMLRVGWQLVVPE